MLQFWDTRCSTNSIREGQGRELRHSNPSRLQKPIDSLKWSVIVRNCMIQTKKERAIPTAAFSMIKAMTTRKAICSRTWVSWALPKKSENGRISRIWNADWRLVPNWIIMTRESSQWVRISRKIDHDLRLRPIGKVSILTESACLATEVQIATSKTFHYRTHASCKSQSGSIGTER